MEPQRCLRPFPHARTWGAVLMAWPFWIDLKIPKEYLLSAAIWNLISGKNKEEVVGQRSSQDADGVRQTGDDHDDDEDDHDDEDVGDDDASDVYNVYDSDAQVNTTSCSPDDFLPLARERYHPHKALNPVECHL